ncbi:uncharacterized protein LY89DRAFT_734917 [Mollisia scopiformis]|uniref:Uncharacterized protein n=1 Tax=Mollisia scopiformis TaxID=149040 RepID=A0A194X7I1_MOLSC|nr:uncharacterized protein LY89DRAFT_734917 [Mollisia scopiformis]KUJ15767.1 hypothetical protein LY89DRAFT_734917 [Mollisia scopiformis]
MSYTQRPNRPQGAEYCGVLPACVAPRGLGVETLERLLRRYNHARLDWEGRQNPPNRQWQAVSLAVSAPGAVAGDLFLPDGDWSRQSQQNAVLLQSVWRSSSGVSVWASNPNPQGGVLFLRVRGPVTTTVAGALVGPPQPPSYQSDSDSDQNTDDEEEEEEGNTTGM